ncbi:hypothetical protein [Burkholderia seminalis]|uniref:hypothetical protein n=2 Tax=Burkholderiaceae TaxID=119060 RepID=UPI0021AB8964|nr:hypothetical protein [Burkholderia seminalis]
MKLARRRFVLIGARVMAAYAADAELSFPCRFIVGKMPRLAGRRPGHEKGEAACRAAKNEQRKEILRAWLTDVHPDDVVASGEGFNAWLISVTHGYVDVDRLKTVASMIPVLNNLMALADALTDIVSIIRKRGGELLDYLGLAINLIGVIPFPPVLAPMRLTARPLLATSIGR